MTNQDIASEMNKLAEQAGLLTVLAAFGSDLQVRLPMSNALWESDLNELCLSTRSSNALQRIGISRIGSIVELSMNDNGLTHVRNLGKKSISEIKTALLVCAYDQLSAAERLEFWQHFVQHNTR